MANIRKTYTQKRRIGLSPKGAMYDIIEENTKKRFGNQQIKKEEDFRTLKRKVSPGSVRALAELAFSRQLMRAKKKTIADVFGLQGEKLGLVLIQPEALHRTKEIKQYLTKVGCTVVYLKPIVFSKSLIFRLFGERQLQLYYDFPIAATRLMSAPSRILVFKHPNPSDYTQIPRMHALKQSDPATHAHKSKKARQQPGQGAFNRLVKGKHDKVEAGTIRGDVVWPEQIRDRFGTTNLTPIAKKLDPFNFFQSNPQFLALENIVGVHAPTADEIYREAANFFTFAELNKIKNALKEK
ncbi:MAG: hypothetical protein WC821_03640 [archaeon]|jgi:hypothetical protein